MNDPGKEQQKIKHEDEGIPFFPLHMMKEIMVVICVLIVLITLSTLHPAGLEEAADSFKTPQHIKPEWYFLSVYQALKYVPQGTAFFGLTYLNLAVAMQGVVMVLLLLVPFIDRSPYKKIIRRPLFLLFGVFALIFMVVFTYLGHYSGGKDPIFGLLIH